jgi:hypothetical protein
MAGAKKAWKNMSATLTRERKAGFMMPHVGAGERVRTVKQATHKAQGKKRITKKRSSRKIAVGV